ncbi:lytic transglycosylase domain-containing protein [Thauera sp. SDU_THAU2]|uniref:lytic transglycosylase domain-containing protein n=1 Tax=Thauera sp. SDU_THAU2 TaxID=3136633 RepID=UPI0031203D85
MKHATRINALARQASGAVFGIAHGAVLFFGLAGMAYLGHDGGSRPAIGYADLRVQGKAAPTVSEAAMAQADAYRAQPALMVPQKPEPALVVPSARKSSALASLRMPDFGLDAGDDGLSPEMLRVRDWITDTYRVPGDVIEPALMAAEESAEEHGFDPLLIVAIMAVESSFNPRAVSNMGAQGLMQVIPRYHQDKIGQGRGKYALFDPTLNVRVGTLVLQEGLQRYGSLQRALQYYNGSLKDPNARYTRKVMAIKKRLVAASGRETVVRNETPASAG